MLQTYACMQYTVIHNIKMNLSTVKWAQWDKTQSRKLLCLFIRVWIALCTIVAHNSAQNRPDNFPSYPPDNHHCPMMSTWGKAIVNKGKYCTKRKRCSLSAQRSMVSLSSWAKWTTFMPWLSSTVRHHTQHTHTADSHQTVTPTQF